MGSPSDNVFTASQERQIGRMVMKQLRDAGQLLDDPEINEYVEVIGHSIVGRIDNDGERFTFFVVNDPAINAFALPGGYIGINTGLIMATDDESELAGVMAHEIAHVTQDHIERRLYEARQSSLIATAGLLAALIMGVSGGSSDAVTGAAMLGQGISAQQQINYTRGNEYEADRVGIGFMASAGYNPQGMASFFDKLGRKSRITPNSVPEILMTHPHSSSRVAEAKNRAAKYPAVLRQDTINYGIARERVRVRNAATGADALNYYRSEAQSKPSLRNDPAWNYGAALALLRGGRGEEALDTFRELMTMDEDVIAYHSAVGQAQLLTDRPEDSLKTFEHAIKLFPRNVPLTLRYSQALIRTGHADIAHELLLDLLNNITPTPEQARLIAVAASEAGDIADAHYYMSEYYVLSGDFPNAINHLQLALAQPDLGNIRRARFEARIKEIQGVLPKKRRKSIME